MQKQSERVCRWEVEERHIRNFEERESGGVLIGERSIGERRIWGFNFWLLLVNDDERDRWVAVDDERERSDLGFQFYETSVYFIFN